ncbi:MAG: pilin [bacterium]|nr:pilin [bacterium]
MLNSGQRSGARLALLWVSSFLIVGSFVFGAHFVSAQLTQGQQDVQAIASSAGVQQTDLVTLIGRIINIFLGFLGVIFLGLMLYAGFTWMTAGGDPAKVDSAKNTIRNAIIGLLIITSAWAITAFIINFFAGATSGGGGISGGGSGYGALVGSSGSLGSGIIEYHVPERNATNAPRNTPIIITFKSPIRPDSMIEGWTEETSSTTNGLNANNIKIFRSGDEGSTFTSAQARVTFTEDRRTYVIRPVDLLGSPSVNVNYSVELAGGNGGILLLDGSPAFSGAFSQGYSWGFEVSTVVDTTPPKILAALPYPGGKYARNVVIQVTFDEAVDPVGASGAVKSGVGFTHIAVRPGGIGVPLDGEYRITNQYRTVEFVTADKCGVNSCGTDVFCLPGDATLEISVRAATLSEQPPLAQFTSQGFDGITDIVGNSLDGNANGTANGPPADSYQWSFGTSNEIKLTPPKLSETVPSASPGSEQSNRPLDEEVTATFDTLMQASTMNSESALIQPQGPGETDPDTFWYSVRMELLNASGMPILPGEVASKAQLALKHRPYLPSGQLSNEIHYYNPFLFSDLQDSFQNCFNPVSSNVCNGAPNCCNNSPKSSACTFTP